MVNILRYGDLLNEEASMDESYIKPEKSLLLFADKVRNDYDKNGGKFKLFYDFYKPENKDLFFGLRRIVFPSILKNEFNKHRFTLLTSSSYMDTDEIEKLDKKLPYRGKTSVRDIVNRSKSFYFYELVYGDRTRYGAPDREHIKGIKNADDKGRMWIFAIERNKPCSVIKTKSRQEGGKWLEYLAHELYGWVWSPHDIRVEFKLGDTYLRENGLIRQLMQAPEGAFTIEDTVEKSWTFNKYDLVVDNEYKLELKKLSDRKERDLWDGSKSVGFVLAEQCKISDRNTLRNIVKWYNQLFEYDQRSKDYRDSFKLLQMNPRDIAYEFSADSDLNKPKVFAESDICSKIRNHCNKQTKRLKEPLNSKSLKKKWMSEIMGIYFGSQDRFDRRWDFIIMTEDKINYKWELSKDWLKFKRLKLIMKISGEAWEYIIAKDNKFIKAFKLKDYRKYEDSRKNGVIKVADGSIYIFNQKTQYWDPA